jgi:hypothetical protein
MSSYYNQQKNFMLKSVPGLDEACPDTKLFGTYLECDTELVIKIVKDPAPSQD